ncbi:MAG: ABC transporter substrate-binding protein, partial [Anaerolineaceae bacterium]|nr:ABC transporter substrate-binding protein [Anaerolineaceae bacterium]
LSEDELPNYLNYGLVEVDDEGEYQTVQTQIIYKLKTDLKWSDNQDLTSKDFIFAYETAKAGSKQEYQWLLERTASFETRDEHSLIWKGIPGFVPEDSSTFLWPPLPEHLYGSLSAQEIHVLDASVQLPVVLGPYQIISWEAGKQINLQPNPNFVLQTPEFPAFENLIFIIQPELEAAISMLEAGDCDVLDPSYRFDFLDKEQLEELAETHKLVVETGPGSLDLVFGIMPASYDVEYYSPWISERQDFFGSLETRRAINACLNTPELIDEIFYHVFPDFVPLPQLKEETDEIDPLQLLEEVGWLLPEDDSDGIRVAQDVPDVLDGSQFNLRLLFGQKEIGKTLAEALEKQLGECGIAVELIPTAENELFEPGPQGPLYGREFDLALVSWPETEAKACERYLSDRIPSPQNNWLGTNVAGLISPGFDELCTSAGVKPTQDGEEISAEVLMQDYLPSLALLPDYRIWAYSQRLTLPDDSGFSDLWKFELSD